MAITLELDENQIEIIIDALDDAASSALDNGRDEDEDEQDGLDKYALSIYAIIDKLKQAQVS